MKTHLCNVSDIREHSFVVASEDVAAFQGKVVHPVCATFTLAREIEYASRIFVLEMKEDNEEGIGTELSITHLGPAFPGEEVSIVATLDQLTHEDVICSFVARVGERLVARGTTGQKVFLKEKIKRHFSRISAGDQ